MLSTGRYAGCKGGENGRTYRAKPTLIVSKGSASVLSRVKARLKYFRKCVNDRKSAGRKGRKYSGDVESQATSDGPKGQLRSLLRYGCA